MVIQSQSLEMLWNDLITKLQDQVLVPLNTYITQFPEVRKRVDKRNRKLTDYDAHRHNLQTLQSNPKKRDEVKIARAKEQLEEARRTYEMLNVDLHDELPALHDSRIPFFVSNLQTVSSAETLFHSETSKVYSELEAVMEQLQKETQAGKYAGTKYALNSSSSSPKGSGAGYPVTSSSPSKSPAREGENGPRQYEEIDFMKASAAGRESSAAPPLVSDTGEYEPVGQQNGVASPSRGEKRAEEVYDIHVGATTEDLPEGCLYKVRATYRYNKEDGDELSFDAGEIIQVQEYEDPEDQEEGWLTGQKESTGEKGLFPANFTRPI